MKITFLTPGEISIPPVGWGALETVVWNQYSGLKQLGHDVSIVNEQNSSSAYHQILDINPDIVHLHYGKHWQIMPHLKCKKIVTTHDGGFLYSIPFHQNLIRHFLQDCTFFILTSWEKALLLQNGIDNINIKILPNGVNNNSFRISDKPKYKNKSICLGKIDQRKRQSLLQSLDCDIHFVGQNTIPEFNPLDDNYLGLWDRDAVHDNLTDYANLILISDSELQPLVCLEALSAGLGLVISEAASQNLDSSKPYISVIPQDKITDQNLIRSTILKNREICLNTNRQSIVDYAKTFDWSEILKKYVSYL